MMKNILAGLLFLYPFSGVFAQCNLSYQYSPNDTICRAQPTTVIITNPGITGTITWSGGDLPAPVVGTQISVSPTSTQLYFVDWVNTTCTKRDTVRLTVIPVRAIITSQTNPNCGQNNGSIIGAASGASLVYTWIRNGVFYSDGASQILNAGAGTYSFAVYDKVTGCSDTVKNITLASNNAFPTFSTINKMGVTCFGEKNGSITVSATGGSGNYSYTWSQDAALKTNMAVGLTSGTPYKITLSDGVCPPIDTTITLSGPSDSVRINLVTTPDNCKQSKGTAKVIATGGSGSYQYSWSVGGQTTDSISGLLGPTRVSITITDVNGCGASKTDTIFNTGSPTANIVSVDSSCVGSTEGKIIVAATSKDGPFSYLWSHDAQLNSATATGLAPGTYSVSVINSLNCAEVLTATVIAYGSGGTGGTLNVGADQTILLGQTAEITITTDVQIKTSKWTPAGVGVNDEGVAFASPRKTTMYELEISYGNNCKLRDQITIFVDSTKAKIIVPTVFTPNGDGLNDLFYVNENGIEKLDIKIFDRWGNLVFQSNDVRFKWDGKDRFSGKELMDGNYPYVLTYATFLTKKEELMKGFITILK